jgi:hypothetical protein
MTPRISPTVIANNSEPGERDMKQTPHQKIMQAAKRGTGCHLTRDEVVQLSMDDAIATCAANDDENEIERRNEECAERHAERTGPSL